MATIIEKRIHRHLQTLPMNKNKYLPMYLRQKSRLFIILLMIGVCSCQDNILYHSYQPTSTVGWLKDDTLSFEFQLIKQPTICELDMGIRHGETYPYQDIWICLNHNLEDSTIYKTDTIHIHLTNQTGDWAGKGIGNIKQYTTHLRTLQLTNKSGNDVKINHIMQDSLLQGINDIGICLRSIP